MKKINEKEIDKEKEKLGKEEEWDNIASKR